MRVTKINLINWYNTATDYNRFPLAQDQIGPPICNQSSLVAVPDETIAFYLNIPAGLTGVASGNLPTMTMAYNSGQTASLTTNFFVDTDIDSTGNGVNTVWCVFNTPTNPAMGLFRFRIVLGSVTLTSSLFEMMSLTDANNCSVRVAMRNTTSLGGVRYPWISDTFYQQVRVRMVEFPTPMVADLTSYRAATTGKRINYNTTLERVRQFKTALYDLDTMTGLEWAVMHDQLLFNQQSVTIKDKPSYTTIRGPLNWAVFSVYDNSFAEPLMP